MTDKRSDSAPAKFSAEFLNAFVDDQLAPEEKSRMVLELSQDEVLSREVCELRKVRDLVQTAYRDLPPAARATHTLGTARRVGMPLAAGIALVVGVTLGWSLHQPPPADAPARDSVRGQANIATPAPAARKSVAAKTPAAHPARTAGHNLAKVLIHVNDDDTQLLAQTLDEVENLLEHYRAQRQQALVEVVINGPGLALVRQDVSRFAARIQRLHERYDNITFAACQNTIDRLRRENGITARLLPGVVVIDSGMAQLMRRQHQGWAYIQG